MPRKVKWTVESADKKARRLAKKDPFFVQEPSVRKWAALIGCSKSLAAKLPFYRAIRFGHGLDVGGGLSYADQRLAEHLVLEAAQLTYEAREQREEERRERANEKALAKYEAWEERKKSEGTWVEIPKGMWIEVRKKSRTAATT